MQFRLSSESHVYVCLLVLKLGLKKFQDIRKIPHWQPFPSGPVSCLSLGHLVWPFDLQFGNWGWKMNSLSAS